MSSSMTKQELIVAANEYLAERSIPGYEDAVDRATTIAEKEAIKASLPPAGEYVDFDGDEYCEDC